MRALRAIRQWCRRLRTANGGTAAVEFALIVPMMLAVYIGTMEASTLIAMDRKVQSVAAAVGDLVARADKTITTAQIQDYFRASSGIMTPYAPEPVLQVVTAINVNSAGVARVVWSRQFRDGVYSATTPHAPNSIYNLPAEMDAISRGQMVITAEASYSYTPLFGIIFNQPVNLYRSSFFMPRFGGTIGPPS